MRNEIRVWFTQLTQLFCTHKSVSFTKIDSKSSYCVCKKCGYCREVSNETPYSILRYSLECYAGQKVSDALRFLESNGYYKVDNIFDSNQYTYHEFYKFFKISYKSSYEKEIIVNYFNNIPRPNKEVMKRREQLHDKLLGSGVTSNTETK